MYILLFCKNPRNESFSIKFFFLFLKKFRENKKYVIYIIFLLLFPLLCKTFVKILFILRKSRENTKHDNTLLLSFCVLQKFRENNESSIYFFFLFCKNIREIVFFAFFAIISLNHWLFKIFLLWFHESAFTKFHKSYRLYYEGGVHYIGILIYKANISHHKWAGPYYSDNKVNRCLMPRSCFTFLFEIVLISAKSPLKIIIVTIVTPFRWHLWFNDNSIITLSCFKMGYNIS